MRLKKYFKFPNVFYFVKGIKSVFGITKNYFSGYSLLENKNLSPQQQDGLAIRKDWENVGNYLKNSINKYGKSLSKKLNI